MRIVVFTCATNWMILTKMLRGMSLGTTLRDPFGKSVVIMVLSRLETQKQQNMCGENSYQTVFSH